jgi:hypothetical protein
MEPVSTCTARGCNAPLAWGVTEYHKRMPLDPEPCADGRVIRVRRRDGKVLLHVLTGAELPWLGEVTDDVGPYMPHHRTCRDADRFRDGDTGPRRCRVCRGPLAVSVTIPVRPGDPEFTTHPGCDPAQGADRVRAALRAVGAGQTALDLDTPEEA